MVNSIHSTQDVNPNQTQWPKVWLQIWFFVLGTAFVFLWIGYGLAERLGLFLGLLTAVAFNLLIFIFGDAKLIRFLKAERVLGQDPWALQKIIADLSENLEMSVPTLYVFQSSAANAFTIGIPWKASALGMSSALLEKLNHNEREAVIAFLLVQIKQTETFAHGIATILSNTLAGIAQQLDRLWPVNFFFDRKQRPFLKLMAPWAWILIKIVRPSKRYVQSDAWASELLGQRQILADVLWRLQGLAETRPLAVPPCTSHHFIVNPESHEEPFFLTKTHPPMKYRLEKLIGYYPI